MTDNPQNHDNAASDGTIEEGFARKVKIDDNNDSDKDSGEAEEVVVVENGEEGITAAMTDTNGYPHRPNEPDCIYYLRTGSCGYGDACKFNHPPQRPAANGALIAANGSANLTAKSFQQRGFQNKGELPQRAGQPDCGYFVKTGTCKYGSTCKYHHPTDRRGIEPPSLNMLGLPMREGEKSCPYYLRTFTCKYGAACKFHHPQPSSVDTLSSNTLSAVSGAMGTTGLTSTIGESPTWSSLTPPYPALRTPQTYMPFVFHPPGMITAQGWSTYVGNMNPALGYSLKNPVEPSSNGQLDVLTSDMFSLPERPDQPECRYFMNNGTCKYGSECKYHHPKEKTAQLAMSSLGPHGLPLRPGQAMCSSFSAYGVCRYGPTCRFDHPVSGYLSNYGFGLPSLPMLDQSLHPYQRNSSIRRSSGTWPPKSVKISEWIKKPENIVEVEGNSDADGPEDQHGHSQTATTEVHGQSYD